LGAGFSVGKEGKRRRRWLEEGGDPDKRACGVSDGERERKARLLACGPGGLLGSAQAKSGGGESGRAREGRPERRAAVGLEERCSAVGPKLK
jgi:hypothetical protein